jgi:[ribosomal protein S5]-alanine N-acetyltransferase
MIGAPESFTTARLRLRRPQLSDVSAVFAYGSDIEVARYMDWPKSVTPQDTARATERAIHRWESGKEFSWRLTVPPDDTPIGGVACSIEGHRAELGFLVARQFWGEGYATEGARAVFAWLASLGGVLRIQATCDIDNKASARVLEKLGMLREAVLHNWVVRPNLPGRPVRDALLYAWVRAA